MTLDKLRCLSVPQFTHLWNGDNDTDRRCRVLGDLRMKSTVEQLGVIYHVLRWEGPPCFYLATVTSVKVHAANWLEHHA